MDAVILDVGGVLLVPHHETLALALAPWGIRMDEEDAQRAHYFGVRAIDAAGDDEIEVRQAYLLGYAEAAGVPRADCPTAVELIGAAWNVPNLEVWRQQVRGSADGLRQLASRGYRLGIISNSDGTVEEQLRRGEICQVGAGLGVPVVAIIDSAVVGVSKPEPDIFRLALEPLGVPPEKAVYVGDSLRYDVVGARAAGLMPVHFDPYELCGLREDHAHASSIARVAGIIC